LQRQLAVIKGQAWNIVQSLRHHDEGPLELTRRVKVLVWDDEIEIAEELVQDEVDSAIPPPSPKPSVSSVPLPKRRGSGAADFPPPMRRTSTDAPRPVPFAAKFQKVHPGTTGVTVLEHLERLDAVEASLQRLNAGGPADDDSDVPEVDVGEAASKPKPSRISWDASVAGPSSADPTSPFSPPGSPLLETVPEEDTPPEQPSRRSSMDEEDLVMMSKSTPLLEGHTKHYRWSTQTGQVTNMEWLQQPTDPSAKRIVIVEVCRA
jgi:phosphatidylinositol 4-kinase type 2